METMNEWIICKLLVLFLLIEALLLSDSILELFCFTLKEKYEKHNTPKKLIIKFFILFKRSINVNKVTLPVFLISLYTRMSPSADIMYINIHCAILNQ